LLAWLFIPIEIDAKLNTAKYARFDTFYSFGGRKGGEKYSGVLICRLENASTTGERSQVRE
jgi:hypothetical protein